MSDRTVGISHLHQQAVGFSPHKHTTHFRVRKCVFFFSLSKLAPFKVTPHHFARMHQPMLSATGLKLYERVSVRTHGLNDLLFVCASVRTTFFQIYQTVVYSARVV